MISAVRLENWLCFGEQQIVPLSPITVLVGPNNSGKSSFMRFPACVHYVHSKPGIQTRVGITFADQNLSETGDADRSDVEWEYRVYEDGSTVESVYRRDEEPTSMPIFYEKKEHVDADGIQLRAGVWCNIPKLSHQIKCDFQLQEQVGTSHKRLGEISKGLHAIGKGRVDSLHKKLMRTKNLSKFEAILGRVFPSQSQWRTVADMSDGAANFAHLVIDALDATGLVMLRTPENGLHPSTIGVLVELLRQCVDNDPSRNVQFVIETHSAELLNWFQHEPESVLLFNRTPTGPNVRQLSEVPSLVDALADNDLGSLFTCGALTLAGKQDECLAPS